MRTQELKSLLHESIENINDQDFLLAIKQLLDRKYHLAPEPELSEEQINRLEESKIQIRKGNYLTNEQADKLVAKWLKE